MDQEYDPKVWDGSQKRTKLTVDQQKGIWEERRLRATKNAEGRIRMIRLIGM